MTIMKTIEDLRKDAQNYFCKSCFEQYKRYFEPEIRHLLFYPIEDWSAVEFYVTQMVMKKKGVEGKNIDEYNIYQKIEKWWFTQKINYLDTEGILQKSSKELLDKANKVRNKIHSRFLSKTEKCFLSHIRLHLLYILRQCLCRS